MAEHDGSLHHREHLDEAHWEALADDLEAEGELLLGFVTDAIRWARELRGPDAPSVRRVLDIGSGPGVGTCELARLFPAAHVVALDGSRAMLERTAARAATHGLGGRISTHMAELPDGLGDLENFDVIWASMSLHHVADDVAALRMLRDVLNPSGLMAIAEYAEPMRVLPDPLEIGRHGMSDRIDSVEAEWFATMREGLGDPGDSSDLSHKLSGGGFEVLGTRLVRLRFEPPLSDEARRVVLGHLRHVRDRVGDRLCEDDLQTLDVLTDTDDRRGVMSRPDVFVEATRQIYIARPVPDH